MKCKECNMPGCLYRSTNGEYECKFLGERNIEEMVPTRVKIKDSNVAVEVIPYYSEGRFIGFSDVTGGMQAGNIIYNATDLEFPEGPIVVNVDWLTFRREAAKDILCAIVNQLDAMDCGACDGELAARQALMFADELIKKIKKRND